MPYFLLSILLSGLTILLALRILPGRLRIMIVQCCFLSCMICNGIAVKRFSSEWQVCLHSEHLPSIFNDTLRHLFEYTSADGEFLSRTETRFEIFNLFFAFRIILDFANLLFSKKGIGASNFFQIRRPLKTNPLPKAKRG